MPSLSPVHGLKQAGGLQGPEPPDVSPSSSLWRGAEGWVPRSCSFLNSRALCSFFRARRDVHRIIES